MDEITIIERLVGSYGFPIVVAGYLLWERRKVMKEYTDALTDLKAAVVALTARITGVDKGD